MEGPRRYWVNAPFGIPDLFDIEDFEDGEERRGLKRIDAELERAGFCIGETDWVYKTRDKEEAIEMANIAREIWREESYSENALSKSLLPLSFLYASITSLSMRLNCSSV